MITATASTPRDRRLSQARAGDRTRSGDRRDEVIAAPVSWCNGCARGARPPRVATALQPGPKGAEMGVRRKVALTVASTAWVIACLVLPPTVANWVSPSEPSRALLGTQLH